MEDNVPKTTDNNTDKKRNKHPRETMKSRGINLMAQPS